MKCRNSRVRQLAAALSAGSLLPALRVSHEKSGFAGQLGRRIAQLCDSQGLRSAPPREKWRDFSCRVYALRTGQPHRRRSLCRQEERQQAAALQPPHPLHQSALVRSSHAPVTTVTESGFCSIYARLYG